MTKLFSPEIPHEVLPKKQDVYNVHRIKVEGVLVRYVENMHSVQMTVEGELPPATIEALASDLTYKLSALENAPVVLKQL
jgi:negative regulator of sigma E activity